MAFGSTLKKKPSAEDDEIDITPMIDCTFLLLIFFMVTSKMEKSASLHIPPAQHGVGVPVDKSTVISIFKEDAGPEVYLANEEKKNGPVDLGAVTDYVRSGVSEGKFTVIIKADRDIPAGFVEDVARAANEVEAPDGELKFFVGIKDKPK